jgi:hypothetical protein
MHCFSSYLSLSLDPFSFLLYAHHLFIYPSGPLFLVYLFHHPSLFNQLTRPTNREETQPYSRQQNSKFAKFCSGHAGRLQHFKILCSDYTAIHNSVTILHRSRLLLTVMWEFVVQLYTPVVTHEQQTALFFEL